MTFQSGFTAVGHISLAAGRRLGLPTVNSAAGIEVDGSITAAAGTAHGMLLLPTLVASANNDIFTGVRVQPTVTPGAFTGLSARLVWIRNPSGNPNILYGIYIDSMTAGVTGFNYAIYTNTGRIRCGDVIEVQNGTVLAPQYTFESNRSLGFFVSGAQTIAQSLGTLNLATGTVNLSMATLAAATSAVDRGLAIVQRASGISIIYKSGSSIYDLGSGLSGTA